MKPLLLFTSLIMLITGCKTMGTKANKENMKFKWLFSWGSPTIEEITAKYAADSKNTHSRGG